MTEPRITRLPSQAVRGNNFGRTPSRRQIRRQADDLQQWEYQQEAYLVDGWQDDRPRV